MTKKLFLTATFLLVCLCTAHAQRSKYLHFGPTVDYVLLNDRTIGDIPLKGADIGLRIGFDNIGQNSLWGIGLTAGVGFANTYHFPNLPNRIADRYFGSLDGEYLHRVNRPDSRLKVYVGGQMNLSLYYNQIRVFTNSETNYFFHLGLAPKVRLDFPFRMFRRGYSLIGAASYDVLAVVARPGFSMPFPGDRMDNVRVASLAGYGMARTHVGLYHRMRNGNAWEAAYRWQFDFDNHLNTVRQAVHGVSFVLYMNL